MLKREAEVQDPPVSDSESSRGPRFKPSDVPKVQQLSDISPLASLVAAATSLAAPADGVQCL